VVKVPNAVAVVRGALPAYWRVADPTIFGEYERELRTMERLLEPDDEQRRHPGYAHIHRVLVHVECSIMDCGYPMLFSEPCDGTLEALAARPRMYPDSDAPTWRELARQTLSGFDYMLSRRIGNVDIHCGNVFYKKRGPRTYHYVLADFGGVCVFDLGAANNPWTNTRLRCSLLCLCDEVLNYPLRIHNRDVGEPYASVMRPLLDEAAFVHGCSDARAQQLYDDLVGVAGARYSGT
jgi:hypothetical protein